MDNVSAVAIVDVCTYVVDSVIGVDADDVDSLVDVGNVFSVVIIVDDVNVVVAAGDFVDSVDAVGLDVSVVGDASEV